MLNPFNIVKDFESALCEYTGAPYAVTTKNEEKINTIFSAISIALTKDSPYDDGFIGVQISKYKQIVLTLKRDVDG